MREPPIFFIAIVMFVILVKTKLYCSCVTGSDLVSLHAMEIVYDPKSPRFGAGQKDSNPGLWIDWALDDTGICKGDR